jgi:hypothetical protein
MRAVGSFIALFRVALAGWPVCSGCRTSDLMVRLSGGGLPGVWVCYLDDERVLARAARLWVGALDFTPRNRVMRIVIDIMIALMLIAVVAGGLYLYNSEAQGERKAESVRFALQQLQEQAAYHTTVQSAMAGHDVLLVHLHEQWFGEDVPANALVQGDRPWIDLAPPGDLGEHPPDPVVYNEQQAGFWYNPTTGTFRARVSPASSEAQTLALYNEVNGTALEAFDVIPDTSRKPLAHAPGQTPVKQYATMANKTWSETKVEDDLPETDLIVAKQPDTAAAELNDLGDQANPGVDLNSKNTSESQGAEDLLPEVVEAGLLPESRPTLERLKNE